MALLIFCDFSEVLVSAVTVTDAAAWVEGDEAADDKVDDWCTSAMLRSIRL